MLFSLRVKTCVRSVIVNSRSKIMNNQCNCVPHYALPAVSVDRLSWVLRGRSTMALDLLEALRFARDDSGSFLGPKWSRSGNNTPTTRSQDVLRLKLPDRNSYRGQTTASPDQQNGIPSAEYLNTLRTCRYLIVLSEDDSKSFVVR